MPAPLFNNRHAPLRHDRSTGVAVDCNPRFAVAHLNRFSGL